MSGRVRKRQSKGGVNAEGMNTKRVKSGKLGDQEISLENGTVDQPSSTASSSGVFLQNLPNELRLHVLSKMDEREKYKIGRVNRVLRNFMRNLPQFYRRTNLDRTILHCQIKRGGLFLVKYLRCAESSLRRQQFSEHEMFKGEMTAFKDYLSDNLLHLNARILHLEIAELDEMACDSFLQMRLSTDDVLVFELHKCSVHKDRLAQLLAHFSPKQLHLTGNFNRSILDAEVFPESASSLFIGCLLGQGSAEQEFQPDKSFFDRIHRIWGKSMKKAFDLEDPSDDERNPTVFLELTAITVTEKMLIDFIQSILHEPWDMTGEVHYHMNITIHGSRINHLRFCQNMQRIAQRLGVHFTPIVSFNEMFANSYMWYVMRTNGLKMLTITVNLRQTEQERYLIVPKLVLRDKSVDRNFLVKRNPRKRKAT
ncbi:hypothetical protein WR25_14432 [Diploscapter pachys]|uniref:F-box domain-containing protein n=1 Tax=Diploscapter pachys TaxID=2018661 RepID=A0A2A2JGC2_9BILA|nr:hypothetical protein WR25_14432 [Diploscapter pachys]